MNATVILQLIPVDDKFGFSDFEPIINIIESK